MEGIKLIFYPDGSYDLDVPCGMMPNLETLERLSKLIRIRKEAVA